ncbi:MAG: hypothetical protein EBE86_020120 [Hormoscilla sp. GUM202]|nr:hypothetical protein [Hormoscilla sp. GUM202]
MATKQLSNGRLKGYIETLGNAGNFYAPSGTRPWAIAVRSELQSLWHDAKFNAQQLKSWRDLMKQHAGYRQLVNKDGKAFSSYEEFCQAKPPFGLGCAPSDIDQIIQELELVDAKTFEVEDTRAAPDPPKPSAGPDLTGEGPSREGSLQRFSKLVQSCPENQPINAAKIGAHLKISIRTAHTWRKRWLDLGWIEPLPSKKRGYYQIAARGRKVVKDWLEKAQSATINGELWLSIPRHNPKKAGEQLIKSFDSEQLRELHKLIGESLKQESKS